MLQSKQIKHLNNVGQPILKPNSHNEDWYLDSDINSLLKFSLAQHEGVEVLTAMLGTDWLSANEKGYPQHGNVLKDNLVQFKPLATTSKVIIPVNLNNNHWTLLYLACEAGKPKTAYYFDPKGSYTPNDIACALNSVYPNVEILSLDSQLQADSDNNNCGVWVVEAAKSFVTSGALPSCDIQQARREHRQILDSIKATEKSCEVLSQLGLFKSSEKMATLNSISNRTLKSYVETYLDSVKQRSQTTTNTDELLAIRLQNEEIASFLNKNHSFKR